MGLVGNSFGQERSRASWSGTRWSTPSSHGRNDVDARARRLRALPRLRVSLHEAGCGWLPSWLHRIDEQLELASLEFPDLTMSATDYFRRNCWITTECEDRYVSDVIGWFGDGHIIYESDFPHPDSKFPHSVDASWPRPRMFDRQHATILENAVD